VWRSPRAREQVVPPILKARARVEYHAKRKYALPGAKERADYPKLTTVFNLTAFDEGGLF
jgi:hypothetical protein